MEDRQSLIGFYATEGLTGNQRTIGTENQTRFFFPNGELADTENYGFFP
jgi:hypothetical protein